MSFAWYDLVGLVGVVVILYAYLMLQLDRMEEDELAYSLLNAVGALAVLVSLLFEFNLSAMLMEGSWFLVSLIGIARWWRSRRRRHAPRIAATVAASSSVVPIGATPHAGLDAASAARAAIEHWPHPEELARFALARHGFRDAVDGFGITYPDELDDIERSSGKSIPAGFVEAYGYWGLPNGYEVLVPEATYRAVLVSMLAGLGRDEDAELVRRAPQAG